MIPVIHQFLDAGYQVIIGGSGKSGTLLQLTFPELPFIAFSSPQIKYSTKERWFTAYLLLQLPALVLSTFRDHRRIKEIVKRHHIHTVVSDNRYGLFCRQAYCIFITHQVSPVLRPLFRWAEYPLYLIICRIIHQFNECWIPDFADPENNLSGKLSHRFKLPRNARYIGILSRFKPMKVPRQSVSTGKYDLVIILSGPEPQRSKLFRLLMDLSIASNKKTLIISGLDMEYPGHMTSGYLPLTIVSHLDPRSFCNVLLHAGAIISRSGYSSIMDLTALGRSALLVPTPGQSEQEYLAEYLNHKGFFSIVQQQDLTSEYLMKYLEDEIQMKKTVSIARNPTRNPE
jgi:hypothetical protein